MAIESTPDSGVEIRKAVVAPLFAPCFFKPMAAGNTPQEHKGTGMPKKAALNTDRKRPRLRCLAIECGLKKTRKKPLINNPNRMYIEDSSRRSHVSESMLKKRFMLNITLVIP